MILKDHILICKDIWFQYLEDDTNNLQLAAILVDAQSEMEEYLTNLYDTVSSVEFPDRDINNFLRTEFGLSKEKK